MRRGEKAVAGFSLIGERRRAMRTVKWNPFVSGVLALLGGLLVGTGTARADVSSTTPAAIVVFPRIFVSLEADFREDTIIQLTNTAAHPVNVRCFYVNANGHCSDDGDICDPDAVHTDPDSCGSFATCVPEWQETDFHFRLT